MGNSANKEVGHKSVAESFSDVNSDNNNVNNEESQTQIANGREKLPIEAVITLSMNDYAYLLMLHIYQQLSHGFVNFLPIELGPRRKNSNGRRILPLIDSTSAVSSLVGIGKGNTRR